MLASIRAPPGRQVGREVEAVSGPVELNRQNRKTVSGHKSFSFLCRNPEYVLGTDRMRRLY